MIWNILSKQKLLVPLPVRLTRLTIYPLIDMVLDKDLNPRANEIVFDFSKLNFVEPVGITVLSNLLEVLKKVKVKTSFSGLNTQSQALSYLNDSGFFTHYLKKEIYQTHGVRSTTFPLKLVEYSRSYEYIGFQLIPWLSRELSTTEKSLATANVCFQEIFNNIEDHSGVSIGCSFAQHYPQKDQIQISISDFGIGIPANVRSKNPSLTDQQALSIACTQGFTTQTTPRNRGAGLHVLIKNVVHKNGGTIIINSLEGISSFTNNSGSIHESSRSASGYYPGTLIQIIFDKSKFVFDQDVEEFEW